jgi:hypothetical protein
MLDVILDGFGAFILFGQAALFLARGRIETPPTPPPPGPWRPTDV